MDERTMIYLDDAIDALVEKGQASRRYKLGQTWELNLSEIHEALDSIPSAQPEQRCDECVFKPFKQFQPEQRWIPCSERLPEDLEEVNVTWVNHDPEPYYAFVKDKPFTASAVYYKGKWYWYSSTCRDLLAEYGRNPNQEIDDGIEIIAWQPLPEPYRGES